MFTDKGVLRYVNGTTTAIMQSQWYDELVSPYKIGDTITRKNIMYLADRQISKKDITLRLYHRGFKMIQNAPECTYIRVSFEPVKMYEHPVEADKDKFLSVLLSLSKRPFLTNKEIIEAYGEKIRLECVKKWMIEHGYVREERIRAWVKKDDL